MTEAETEVIRWGIARDAMEEPMEEWLKSLTAGAGVMLSENDKTALATRFMEAVHDGTRRYEDTEPERVGVRIHPGAHRGLFEMLDAMVEEWPLEGSYERTEMLAGILAVELWSRQEELRWRCTELRPDIEGLDRVMGASTEGWTRIYG